MNEKLKELMLQADRLEAVQACRNLMGKYSYLHTAFRNLEYVELWAKREDCWITMPFGRFEGWEGVRHCYVDIHGDRSEPDYQEFGKGLMMLHEMDTEIIEVAADGKTAKACFISPGHETSPAQGKEKGAWCWGKYYVEFIKEDGVWKFWHLILYPLILSPYNKSWGEPQDDITEGKVPFADPTGGVIPLEKPMWEYGPGAIYPADEPHVPAPYESYPGID